MSHEHEMSADEALKKKNSKTSITLQIAKKNVKNDCSSTFSLTLMPSVL